MGSVSPRQSAAAQPATNALRVNVERVAFVFLPIETILTVSLPFLRILRPMPPSGLGRHLPFYLAYGHADAHLVAVQGIHLHVDAVDGAHELLRDDVLGVAESEHAPVVR